MCGGAAIDLFTDRMGCCAAIGSDDRTDKNTDRLTQIVAAIGV